MQCVACSRPVREDLTACPGCGANLSCYVLGSDRKPYGPYSLADVRRYVEDRRVPVGSQVSVGGGAWQPLAPLLGSSPGAYAPPVSARGGTGTSSTAIVLIAIGALFLAGLIGGALMLRGVRSGGLGLAGPQGDSCRSNLKQVGLGMLMFAQDHNETFPNADTWRNDLMPYIKNQQVFECPRSGQGSASYQMNPRMSQRRLAEIPMPATTPLVYDAGFPNGTPTHPEGWNVVFVDGHCKAVSPSEAVQYQSP
jgi:prepilin-type processing-associated H-X9-DG protein